MQYKRLLKGGICIASLLALSLICSENKATMTTMASETEMAGMSFALDKYCDTQSSKGVKNPEAIVAFQTTKDTGRVVTQDELDSIDAGVVDEDPTPTPTVTSGGAVAAPKPTKKPAATPKPTVKPKSEYSHIGISVAESYVNIRRKPTEKSKVVGKLYRGSAARIEKWVGSWVKIRSGRVTGYIKKEFLAIGFSAERLIDNFGTKWARVTTQTLKVREAKNTSCTILTLVPEGESYEVIREDKEWVKIEVDGTTKGFVSKDYVKISVRFKKAISIAEERAEARRKAAAARAAAQATQAASTPKRSTSSSSSSSSSSHKKSTYRSSKRKTTISSGSGGSVVGSGNGAAIASYALKFVGNPYVYGHTSLTNGTDCSGFTQSVFRNFGISLPRTSRSQSGVGARISVKNARAGDLIFYSSGGRVNHVALCIGGGRVVHASNPSVGITTSNMYYRTPYCARRVIG